MDSKNWAGEGKSGQILRQAAIELQPLAANLYVRRRCDSSLWGTRTIRDGFNHPLPTDMSTFVDSPSCATALVNLHLPVVAVGRNCERVRERGRRHHSAQHSNQKNIYHFCLHGTPFCFISMTEHPANLFMARAVDFAVPLGGCSAFSLSGEFFPTFPLSDLRNSQSSWFLLTTNGHEWARMASPGWSA